MLHVSVQINPVVDLAAAFADEGQRQLVEETQAAAQVHGGLTARAVAPVGLGQGSINRRRCGAVCRPECGSGQGEGELAAGCELR